MNPVLSKCRVCLADGTNKNMFDLFTVVCTEQKSSDGYIELEQLLLYEKIEVCCGVKINPAENMPSKICDECFSLTRMLYEFRQQCINTQQYLESLQKNKSCGNDDIGNDDVGNDDGDNDDDGENNVCDDSQQHDFLIEKLQNSRSGNSSPSENVDTRESTEQILDGIEMTEQQEKILEEDDISIFNESDTDFLDDSDAADAIEQISNTKKTKRFTKSHSKKKSASKKEPKSFMCTICGNVYGKKSMFTHHMTQHSNSRPHECEICLKSFRQIGELRSHMRRHTGERPFKCNYCDRHFIDRSERLRHERVHTNSRPYECTVCGKCFMYSAILNNHKKTHTGEKNYICRVCDKSFTLQHQLKAHLQTLTHRHKEEQCVADS